MASSSSNPLERAYPKSVRVAEDAAIATRRSANKLSPDAPQVGVALSGGGIRSATFCLGLFQALARQGLVRKIDLLSTVSGGGYFGGFLGALFCREGANADTVESELKDNKSWPVGWLRDNGRFLSPNGSGDNWVAAAVALRNWSAVHAVILTLVFLALALGSLVRAALGHAPATSDGWLMVEESIWSAGFLDLWLSPWVLLPVASAAIMMVPTGSLYWLTQFTAFMGAVRVVCGVVCPSMRSLPNLEFAARLQSRLTRGFMLGLMTSVILLVYAVVDTLGQTAYFYWSQHDFRFPSLWAGLTGTGAVLCGFGTRIFVLFERLLGGRKTQLAFSTMALGLGLLWLTLIVLALSTVVCGIAWKWGRVWDGSGYQPMSGFVEVGICTAVALVVSLFFSQCFGFVNLSSLQQVYSARLRRAYIGASNQRRREAANFSMSDLVPGDDFALAEYQPHVNGGPLHLINVTVNETISGKTQVERFDRKGVAMAVGPCGLSVGTHAHALWSAQTPEPGVAAGQQVLWQAQTRRIVPVWADDSARFHPLAAVRSDTPGELEALSVGQWIALSGAAFTTGIGSGTKLGLSLLLGLANVRLGYWWDSGVERGWFPRAGHFMLRDWLDRVMSRVLPVQYCLGNELLARFHGPARRHWYLSDGGHFENTACYELIRRRVPLIICSDAGQDPAYQFADFAALVRMARIDFGAEIELVRRADGAMKDDPGTKFPMPRLEELVHPDLLDVIGEPEDFAALSEDPDAPRAARDPDREPRHALLARIHYTDNDQFSWLLLIKPSLMGDESIDVIQYQRTHPLFPQEPTTDQYFDEAQWESYRKLGEHIGIELFTPPVEAGDGWSPSQLRPPQKSPARG